jgi:predicted MFS family arabinose efflux permease
VFWAYVPLAAVLGLVIAASVPPDAGGGQRPRSLNLAGSAALTAAVMAFVAGTTAIAQPSWRIAGVLALAGCAALAVLFVVIDRRAASPLLPRQLIGERSLRQGALGGFLNTATTSSVITLVTLYLQNTLRRSPLDTAATLLPFSLMPITGSALSAVLQRRLRPQPVMAAGLTVIAAADALLIPLAGHLWAVPACAAAGGTGIGLSSVAATGLGTDVPLHWRGGASGLINTTAQVGTAVGTAVLLLIASATSGIPAAGTAPPKIAWAAGAAAAAAGAAWFAVAGFRDGRPRGTPAPRAVSAPASRASSA